MGEMMFNFRDLYPNMGIEDTSGNTNPETTDQEALNEDVKVAEEVSTHDAKTKNILIALGVMVAIIIFFGGAK